MTASRRFVLVLMALYFVLWTALAIRPLYRDDWLVENILVVALLAVVVGLRNRIRVTRVGALLVFAFMCLHCVGAHYTYAKVPYDAWFETAFGESLNGIFGLRRNHFDRLVHFAYGLLLARPVRELLLQRYDVPTFASRALIVDFAMSTSLLYELAEWLASVVFGGELGAAYLGTQGDPWDAHADMAFASLGALLAMLVSWLVARARDRDEVASWASPLRAERGSR